VPPILGHQGSHQLGDFRLKLNRANTHLETLKREVDAWFGKHPYGITGKYEAGPPERYKLYFRFFETPPREWGLLIGEFAHNARSALDYLAWQLVQANAAMPTTRTQFPIVLTPWEWPSHNGVGRLEGASDRHKSLVETFQPYGPPDSEGFYYYWGRGVFERPLALLAFLSKEDKHRVLVATATALQSIGWDVTGSRDVAPITDLGTPYFGTLEDQSPLIEIPVTATGPNPEVDVEFREHPRVTIEHRIKLTTRPDGATHHVVQRVDLIAGLESIADELARIFRVFVREFV